MIYTRNIISIFILTILMVSGFLALSTGQVRAGDDECEITIENVADPADDTGFYFSVTGDENEGIELRDPSEPTTKIIIGTGDGPLTLTEDVPPGWILDDIQCTEGVNNCGNGVFEPCLSITELPNGNGVILECLDIDTGSCTFFNSRLSRNVPTLSQWGLIAMIGLLGIIGLWAIRRKKAAA